MKYLIAVIAFFSFMICLQTSAFAGPGGMAADGCHKHKSDDRRTTHVSLSDGVNINVDCEAWKTITAKLNAEIISVTKSRNVYRDRARDYENAIDDKLAQAYSVKTEYEGLVAAAKRNYKVAENVRAEAALQAESTLHEAKRVLVQAEERERGAGLPASRDCRRALISIVIDRDAGWLSRTVKVNEKEIRVLSQICLGE